MKPRKRHWYHCTDEFHGETWRAQLRAPRFAAPDEPRTPRLCVAPSICKCLAARHCAGDTYVYRTVRAVSAIPARAVWDYCLTEEGWIVHPVELSLVCVIPGRIVDRIMRARRRYLAVYGASGIGISAHTYLAAVDAIDKADWIALCASDALMRELIRGNGDIMRAVRDALRRVAI